MDWISAVIRDTAKNNDVAIFSLYPTEQEWLIKLSTANIKVENIKFDRPKDIFKVISRLVKALSSNNIVVAHGFYSSIAAVVSGKLRFAKTVVTVRHHGKGHYENMVLKNLDRFISYNSNKVIAISDLTRELLLSEGVPQKKIIVIPNAIDVNRFIRKLPNPREEFLRQLGLNDSHFVIGMVSRFVAWKGINYTIEAFRQLLMFSPNARLVLANAQGKNDYLDDLIATFEENHIVKIDNIGDIGDFYQSLDVFVHTPTSLDAEPSGLVYLEGLASGVNCVFTKSGVALELEELDRYAWLVDFKNSRDIEVAIQSIIEGECKEIPTTEYLSRFTIESYIENFGSFINEITAK